MLKLTFIPWAGGVPVHARSSYFRFCERGTIRGSDNCVIALCSDGAWQLCKQTYREIHCVGPVWLRVRAARDADFVTMGPYASLKSIAGRLFGDGVTLPVDVPGWTRGARMPCYELFFVEPSRQT